MKDETLIEQFLLGSEDAFEFLMQRYEKRIFSFVNAMVNNIEDAKDITQRTFIMTFRKIRNLKEKGQFKNWLYKIALNQTRDFLRTRREETDIDPLDTPNTSPLQEELLISSDLINKAKSLINSLPDKQREVLVLRIFHEMSFQEIAGLTGTKPETLRANFHFGMKSLRKMLREGGLQ